MQSHTLRNDSDLRDETQGRGTTLSGSGYTLLDSEAEGEYEYT